MNYNKGYEVKLVEKQIVLMKDFARKAGRVGTKEYATFMQVRSLYPTFAVVQYIIDQKSKREFYDKLDYNKMERLIKLWTKNDEKAVQEFASAKEQFSNYSGSYGLVKKWFLAKYKEQYKLFQDVTSEAEEVEEDEE